MRALCAGTATNRNSHPPMSLPTGLMPEHLTLTDEDDGKLFHVRVINTGEERIARYHRFTLAGRSLKFPCFADPDDPEDYRRWLHSGWGANAVSPVREE